MKDYKIPYTYFRDQETRNLERKNPTIVKPEDYYNYVIWDTPDGRRLLLTPINRSLYKAISNDERFIYIDSLEDAYENQDGFVFCPGPTMSLCNVSAFNGRLTIAVNSAGFKFNPTLWCMFETGYVRWIINQQSHRIENDRTFVTSARVAVHLPKLRKRIKRCYITQFEEFHNMPFRTAAVSTIGAITTCWYLGCSRVFLIGMDLHRLPQQPYVLGVPYTRKGASSSFEDQVRSIKQIKFPGMEIFNCSPYSRNKLPFQYVPYEELPCLNES